MSGFRKSKFSISNNYRKSFFHYHHTMTETDESWADIFDTTRSSSVRDATIGDGLLHWVTTDGYVKTWDGGSVSSIENGVVTQGRCIEYCPIMDVYFYGGYRTTNNPFRLSINNGSSYSSTNTVSDDYIHDFKEMTISGTPYCFAIGSEGNRMYRCHYGGIFFMRKDQSGVASDIIVLEPFKGYLYCGRVDGYFIKYNDSVRSFTNLVQLETTELISLTNYNDTYLYLGFDNGKVYKFDGTNYYYLGNTGLDLKDSCFYYKYVYFCGAGGNIVRFNVYTDAMTTDDVNAVVDANNTWTIRTDGTYLWTFASKVAGNNQFAYRKRIYLS